MTHRGNECERNPPTAAWSRSCWVRPLPGELYSTAAAPREAVDRRRPLRDAQARRTVQERPVDSHLSTNSKPASLTASDLASDVFVAATITRISSPPMCTNTERLPALVSAIIRANVRESSLCTSNSAVRQGANKARNRIPRRCSMDHSLTRRLRRPAAPKATSSPSRERATPRPVAHRVRRPDEPTNTYPWEHMFDMIAG